MKQKYQKLLVAAGIALVVVTQAFLPVVAVPVASAEEDVDDLEDEYKKTQKKLEKAMKEQKALQQSLSQINSSLNKTLAAINNTQAQLRQTTDILKRKELEVALMEQNIDLKKEMLKALLREMQLSNNKSVVQVMLGEADFSEALDEASQVASFSEKVQVTLDDLQELKSETETEKANLEDLKEKHETVLAQKASEKNQLASSQAETQADLAQQEKIISRLKKELAELEGDLAKLTGKSYDAKDIRDAVEFASKRTGVPEGVLYGFLKKETNLGANTGQCTYDEVEKVSVARYKKYGKKYQASINLLYKRKDIFYDIVKTLGYSKNKKVSCSPSGYIGQGGAMGVPQFMSDVWRGYESRIAAQTGHKNPDPWNLTDGVMAMALKLKAAGATSDKEPVIKKASISYLGTFNSNYYEGIVYWSKNYKQLFK
jgi:peptidoglycan hydrolase CwlO-like protein